MIRHLWNELTLHDAGWQPRVVLGCLVGGAILHGLLWLR